MLFTDLSLAPSSMKKTNQRCSDLSGPKLTAILSPISQIYPSMNLMSTNFDATSACATAFHNHLTQGLLRSTERTPNCASSIPRRLMSTCPRQTRIRAPARLVCTTKARLGMVGSNCAATLSMAFLHFAASHSRPRRWCLRLQPRKDALQMIRPTPRHEGNWGILACADSATSWP